MTGSQEELVALFPQRSWEALCRRATKLGLVRRPIWTELEQKIILEHFEQSSKKIIMTLLPGRTWCAIKTFANTLGKIRKYKNPLKKCSICGKTAPRKEFRRTSGYCKDCESDWKTNRKRVMKKRAVHFKGGKCEICGYSKTMRALTFHHINPEDKDITLKYKKTPGQVRMVNSFVGQGWGWEKIEKELKKCMLVCMNCHMEIEEGLIDLREYGYAEEAGRLCKSTKSAR
jgi:5-methylcytosine-specific restriction endonuclease McrA